MDWKQIISGIVIGAILAIAGTFFSIGQRVTSLEDQLVQQKQRITSLEDQLILKQQRITSLEDQLVQQKQQVKIDDPDDCFRARIVGLSGRTTAVEKTTLIKWEPAQCKMVVQAYQDGALINEFGQVPKLSGEVTLGQATTGNDNKLSTGMIELKIWVPGSGKPADEGVWVKVK